MAKVLELREISFAVGDFAAAFAKFQAMGFSMSPVWEETTPPVQAKLTSMPVSNSSISIMASLGEDTPIARFIRKRGEGIFSFTFLVDDIDAITAQWKAAGVGFVLDAPIEIRGQYSAGQRIPVIRGNWTRPSTLHGIVIELQDFRTEDGRPFRPQRTPHQELTGEQA
jgi:methylmalonyl-CoA/ethylmalonyl-CoA epimerase